MTAEGEDSGALLGWIGQQMTVYDWKFNADFLNGPG
jgi:hypothetical protein